MIVRISVCAPGCPAHFGSDHLKWIQTNGRTSDNLSTHTHTRSGEHMPQRPLSRARVPETSSAFPFGKSEQLNRPP